MTIAFLSPALISDPARVRITAQLIDAETGAHLWADRFDGSLEDDLSFKTKSPSASLA